MFKLSNEESVMIDSMIADSEEYASRYELDSKYDCGSQCTGKCGGSCQAACKSSCTGMIF